MTDGEKLLTPEEVADYLSIAQKTVKDYLRDGKIRGIKIGRAWRVRREDLERFLEDNSTNAK